MARECIQGRDGAEFLSPFWCFLLQEPFNLPFLISAPGPVFSVWSGRQYQHRHLQPSPQLKWVQMLYIYCLISNIFWLDVTILPIFFLCRYIYNLQFIAASICASTFWFSWCSGWAILLTEIVNKLIMTGSFCKEDIFMGRIIYGLLATTLIWESSAGPWLIIGQFTSYPWRYNQQRGEAGLVTVTKFPMGRWSNTP